GTATGGMSSSSATGGQGGMATGSSGMMSSSSGMMSSSSGTMSGSSGTMSGSSGAMSSSSGMASSSSGMSSSSTASSSSGGPTTFLGGCNGMHTVLTGKTYAPNGNDPIPRVRVYIPSSPTGLAPYPTLYCDQCTSPIDPAWTQAVSASDGTFT